MAKTVKVAMIGSGGMAKNHIGPLTGLDDVEVVGFCDVVKERADAMVAEHGGQAFDDPGKMLDTVSPDCCYVLLPPFAHGAAEQACLEREIPFFVEKPINKDIKQAREIAAAVEAKGLMTGAGYMNRYRQALQDAKATLAADPALLVSGGWVSGTPNPSPDRPITMWWVDKDRSGGQMVEQVTHTVDLVRFLCGEVTHVAAFAAAGFNKDIPGYTIDDAMAVTLQLANGGVCHLTSCCASNARGGIWLDVRASQVAYEFTGWDHAAKIFRKGQKAEEVKAEADIFAIEDAHFTAAVRENDPSKIQSSYGDALKTVEISLAANLAAAEKRVVELPL